VRSQRRALVARSPHPGSPVVASDDDLADPPPPGEGKITALSATPDETVKITVR
jgi:hypothetical protein